MQDGSEAGTRFEAASARSRLTIGRVASVLGPRAAGWEAQEPSSPEQRMRIRDARPCVPVVASLRLLAAAAVAAAGRVSTQQLDADMPASVASAVRAAACATAWMRGCGSRCLVRVPHRDTINAVAASSDGTRVACASDDKKVSVTALDASDADESGDDGRDPSVAASGMPGHVKDVLAVAWLRDQAIVSGSADGTLRLWLLPQGVMAASVRAPGSITALAVRADGVLAASCETGHVLVWHSTTGLDKPHLTLETECAEPDLLCFIPPPSSAADGAPGCLVVGTVTDSTLSVWDLGTGSNVCDLENRFDAASIAAVPTLGLLAVFGFTDPDSANEDSMQAQVAMAMGIEPESDPVIHLFDVWSLERDAMPTDVGTVPSVLPVAALRCTEARNHLAGMPVPALANVPGTSLLVASIASTLTLWDLGSGLRVWSISLAADSAGEQQIVPIPVREPASFLSLATEGTIVTRWSFDPLQQGQDDASAAAVASAMLCSSCGASGARQACSLCRSVRYCNATCQKADWAARHRSECARQVYPA